MTAHWGIRDPAAVQGTPEEIEHAFSHAFSMLDRRISLFLCLPARYARYVLFAVGNRRHWETRSGAALGSEDERRLSGCDLCRVPSLVFDSR